MPQGDNSIDEEESHSRYTEVSVITPFANDGDDHEAATQSTPTIMEDLVPQGGRKGDPKDRDDLKSLASMDTYTFRKMRSLHLRMRGEKDHPINGDGRPHPGRKEKESDVEADGGRHGRGGRNDDHVRHRTGQLHHHNHDESSRSSSTVDSQRGSSPFNRYKGKEEPRSSSSRSKSRHSKRGTLLVNLTLMVCLGWVALLKMGYVDVDYLGAQVEGRVRKLRGEAVVEKKEKDNEKQGWSEAVVFEYQGPTPEEREMMEMQRMQDEQQRMQQEQLQQQQQDVAQQLQEYAPVAEFSQEHTDVQLYNNGQNSNSVESHQPSQELQEQQGMIIEEQQSQQQQLLDQQQGLDHVGETTENPQVQQLQQDEQQQQSNQLAQNQQQDQQHQLDPFGQQGIFESQRQQYQQSSLEGQQQQQFAQQGVSDGQQTQQQQQQQHPNQFDQPNIIAINPQQNFDQQDGFEQNGLMRGQQQNPFGGDAHMPQNQQQQQQQQFNQLAMINGQNQPFDPRYQAAGGQQQQFDQKGMGNNQPQQFDQPGVANDLRQYDQQQQFNQPMIGSGMQWTQQGIVDGQQNQQRLDPFANGGQPQQLDQQGIMDGQQQLQQQQLQQPDPYSTGGNHQQFHQQGMIGNQQQFGQPGTVEGQEQPDSFLDGSRQQQFDQQGMQQQSNSFWLQQQRFDQKGYSGSQGQFGQQGMMDGQQQQQFDQHGAIDSNQFSDPIHQQQQQQNSQQGMVEGQQQQPNQFTAEGHQQRVDQTTGQQHQFDQQVVVENHQQKDPDSFSNGNMQHQVEQQGMFGNQQRFDQQAMMVNQQQPGDQFRQSDQQMSGYQHFDQRGMAEGQQQSSDQISTGNQQQQFDQQGVWQGQQEQGRPRVLADGHQLPFDIPAMGQQQSSQFGPESQELQFSQQEHQRLDHQQDLLPPRQESHQQLAVTQQIDGSNFPQGQMQYEGMQHPDNQLHVQQLDHQQVHDYQQAGQQAIFGSQQPHVIIAQQRTEDTKQQDQLQIASQAGQSQQQQHSSDQQGSPPQSQQPEENEPLNGFEEQGEENDSKEGLLQGEISHEGFQESPLQESEMKEMHHKSMLDMLEQHQSPQEDAQNGNSERSSENNLVFESEKKGSDDINSLVEELDEMFQEQNNMQRPPQNVNMGGGDEGENPANPKQEPNQGQRVQETKNPMYNPMGVGDSSEQMPVTNGSATGNNISGNEKVADSANVANIANSNVEGGNEYSDFFESGGFGDQNSQELVAR